MNLIVLMSGKFSSSHSFKVEPFSDTHSSTLLKWLCLAFVYYIHQSLGLVHESQMQAQTISGNEFQDTLRRLLPLHACFAQMRHAFLHVFPGEAPSQPRRNKSRHHRDVLAKVSFLRRAG